MTDLLRTLAIAVVLAGTPSAATTQQPLTEERCPRLVAQHSPRVIPAGFRLASIKQGEVSLTYIGHSTFLIESAAGVRIATDYNDYVRPPVVPDVATMNRAHSTHYTNNPDPGIKHVLRGWGREGEPARYDLQVDDVWVRNVVTNIRDWGGGTALHGNSIFVFESGGVLYRASRTSASHADARPRRGTWPHRRRARAGGWHVHAQCRRHGGGSEANQRAAGDSDARVQPVHAGSVSRGNGRDL